MLSKADNDKLTQTGPGTPLGQLLRAYWQPAALVSEMSDERPVKPVRLLGEDLVLFRRDDGGWGLISRWCAHRGVDLAYARSNNWGFDPVEQRNLTYTGMGLDINVHDQWAVESMGPIQDRTQERLGVSDRAITANRRMLLRAISAFESGAPTPGLPIDAESARALTGPLAIDMIAPTDGWQQAWREREQERRNRSPWASAQAQAQEVR